MVEIHCCEEDILSEYRPIRDWENTEPRYSLEIAYRFKFYRRR